MVSYIIVKAYDKKSYFISLTKHKKKLSDVHRKKICFLTKVKKCLQATETLPPPPPSPQISNGASLTVNSLFCYYFYVGITTCPNYDLSDYRHVDIFTCLSEYRPIGLTTCRTIDLSEYRPVGISTCLSEYRPVGLATCRNIDLSE